MIKQFGSSSCTKEKIPRCIGVNSVYTCPDRTLQLPTNPFHIRLLHNTRRSGPNGNIQLMPYGYGLFPNFVSKRSVGIGFAAEDQSLCAASDSGFQASRLSQCTTVIGISVIKSACFCRHGQAVPADGRLYSSKRAWVMATTVFSAQVV